MNWESKCNWGFGGHCELLSEKSGVKALGTFTIFSLKLVRSSIIEKMKLKLLVIFNKKLLL